MPTDFGFLPSNEIGTYFISYNSEDGHRVGAIARDLHSYGVSMWYDYGLEYGAEWERQIASHIRKSKAIIMFITKALFLRETRSYVYKEYRMAKMCDKKVYVVIMDKISNKDIPEELWSWWIDLTDLHCIMNPTAQSILQAIGTATHKSCNLSDTADLSPEELFSKGCDYYCDKNFIEAVRCYRLAADRGNPDAQFCLALCYRDGEGVPKNKAEELRYYKMAAKEGLAEAIQALKELGINY